MKKYEFMDNLLNDLMDKVLDTVGDDPSSNESARASAFKTMLAKDPGLTFVIVGMTMSGVNTDAIVSDTRLSSLPRYLKKILAMAGEHVASNITSEEKFIEMMRVVYRASTAPETYVDTGCDCPVCTERRARANADVHVTKSGIKYHGPKNG